MEVVIGKTEVLLLLVIVGGSEIGLAKYFPWLALYLDFPLVLVIYIGWYSRPAKAALCGSAFGLLADAFFRILLGLNGVSKTTIGFVTAYLNRWVLIGGFFPRLFVISSLTLLDNLIVFCMLELLSQPVREGFGYHALIRGVVTGLAGVVIFQVYDWLKLPRREFRA